MFMLQSTIRYIILGILMWLAGHGVFSADLVTDKTVGSITGNVLFILVPLGAWLWSGIEKKVKSITLPSGAKAVIVANNSTPAQGKLALGILLAIGISLGCVGCASFSAAVADVETTFKKDIPGVENALNALWTLTVKGSAVAETVIDSTTFANLMKAWGVSPATTAVVQAAVTNEDGIITVSQNTLNLLDATVAAASATK